MRRPTGFFLLLLGFALVIASGCSDSTGPGTTDEEKAVGTLDPGAGTFTLKDLTIPGPNGVPIPIRLEGANLVSDPLTGTASLDVVLQNLGQAPVDSASAMVWLRDFVPENVWPTNADLEIAPPWASPPDSTFPHSWVAYGYAYGSLFGDDGVLSPGESSGPRTWIFSDPDLVAFGFSATLDQIFPPAGARIAGRCFIDRNNDGVPQPNEPPFSAGAVQVTGPGGDVVAVVNPDPDGRWQATVAEAGLYEVRFDVPFASPLPPPFTTPNPRQVLITAGADGRLQSFLNCDFGLDIPIAELVPPIQFTDAPPDSLHGEPLHLIGFEQQGRLLRLHVGYSGCQPDHVFSLWLCGGIAETQPPQAEAVLLGEAAQACPAAWEDTPVFDLGPLFERLGVPIGDPNTGPILEPAIVLNLHLSDGQITPIPIQWTEIMTPIGPDGH